MKAESLNRSPIIQLAATRAHRVQRIAAPELPRISLRSLRREMPASRHAAELVCWQKSGGDSLALKKGIPAQQRLKPTHEHKRNDRLGIEIAPAEASAVS